MIGKCPEVLMNFDCLFLKLQWCIRNPWLGRFLGITGWDPCVCKSNRLHVDILWFSFTKLGYILQIPLKWSVTFLRSWTSTGHFSNSAGSSVTNCRFSPSSVIENLQTLQFHVDIVRFWCFHSLEVYYSIDSSKMMGNPPEVLMKFNRLFLKLSRFICN